MLCCVRIGLMTSTAAAIHMIWSAPKGVLRVCVGRAHSRATKKRLVQGDRVGVWRIMAIEYIPAKLPRPIHYPSSDCCKHCNKATEGSPSPTRSLF